ncbi:MAG TPA: S16 family serine protease [Phycisphaerae bacterium]|nr:S16 family serine protease [Phycisphaerae bacterium]
MHSRTLLTVALLLLFTSLARAEKHMDIAHPLGPVTVTQNSDGSIVILSPKNASDEGRIDSLSTFKVPLVMTIVAKTSKDNLRLYFGQHGRFIFNWELNESQLRGNDLLSNDTIAVDHQGAVPKDQFVTIKWTIDKDSSTLEVDGQQRTVQHGDYSNLSGKIGVGAFRSRVVLKSLTVTSLSPQKAQPSEPNELDLQSDDVVVPSSLPKGTQAPANLVTDPAVIERPEFQYKTKPLPKSISSIRGLSVMVDEDGQEFGQTLDIIATIPPESRHATSSGAGIATRVGPDMRTSFEEAVRAIELRYPYWDPAHIDISFGDKYTAKDGGSAGTAMSCLMLSLLEGFEIDPKFAITGDITVDWKVRPVGGITAKLRGAYADKCLYAAIPVENEPAFTDMHLLFGDASIWNLQVFSIETLQEASALVNAKRTPQLTEAMKLFADLQPLLTANEHATLRKPETAQTLKHILELAPNHLSAKHLLALIDGTEPRTLTATATLYNLGSILHPYALLIRSGDPINKENLSYVTMSTARKRLAAIRAVTAPDLQPLVTDAAAYIEAVNNVAYNNGPISAINIRAETYQSQLRTYSTDPDFMDKLVRDGY